MAAVAKLAGKSIGGGALWFFSVGASAPLTVVISVVTTFASTGVVGVPLSFVLLGSGLTLMTVGFVYMASHVRHPALFYALAARGLNPVVGVGCGMIVLFAYVSIHLSLYGLLGQTVAAVMGADWSVWAAIAWAGIAVLAQLRVDINARFFAWTLVAEIVVVLLFTVVAFTRPADDTIPVSPLSPGNLFTDQVGKTFALGVAAFMGFETAATYSEEARTRRAVIRATFGALVFVTVLYTLAAWAIPVWTGPALVEAAAKADPELPLTVLSRQFGLIVQVVATFLLWSSIFAAMLGFHNAVIRNIFGMAREGVLPASLAGVGDGVADGGAPKRASRLVSGFCFTVLVAVRLFGLEPLTMFKWLAAGSAVGILMVLLVTQAASYQYFRSGGGAQEGQWVRQVAPIGGAVAGAGILLTTVANLGSLLGVTDGSAALWVVPGAVAAVAVAVVGMLYGGALRWSRPGVYAMVGRSQPDSQAPEQRLSGLDL